ncbi:lysylphosphatidylglycerol synthase domain-containing protein [Pseudofrankia saprophytica]|uniref:lysylphosphatidylglycerol synthase transmembrane domain-containing protein n=1 Tax=Pseudofrankia saprophytica TaxID=298655 RepID=UPI000234D913
MTGRHRAGRTQAGGRAASRRTAATSDSAAVSASASDPAGPRAATAASPASAASAPSGEQGTPAAPRRKGGPRAWLVRGALLVAAGLLVATLVSRWHEVSASLRELSVVGVVGSGVATVVAVGLTVLSWRAVLAGLGARLPLRAATRIFFVGQVGKYIPGSVWPVLAQMELSRDYGVARPRSAAASLIVLALAVPCGGLVAAATLPFVSRDALTSYWWAFAAAAAFALLLLPPVLRRLLALAFRLLRRPAMTEPVPARAVLAGAGWLVVSFGCYGAATFLLARDLGASVGGPRLLALAVGGYALSWTAGFLVLVLPAGLGVREAVLVLALSPALARDPALVLALVSRLFATVADLVWAGVGVALRPRGATQPAPEGSDPSSMAGAPPPGGVPARR